MDKNQNKFHWIGDPLLFRIKLFECIHNWKCRLGVKFPTSGYYATAPNDYHCVLSGWTPWIVFRRCAQHITTPIISNRESQVAHHWSRTEVLL
jgi:hypothetical protein